MKNKTKDTNTIRSLDIDDAKKYGHIAAFILYEIRTLLKDKTVSELHNGRLWTTVTMKTLAERFGVTSKQIARTIQKLREDGILLVDNFNTHKWDKTNWYSINEEADNEG